MSKAVHCDGPGCETWQQFSDGNLEYPPHAQWITAKMQGHYESELNFCAWRCVAAFAKEKMPVAV